MPSARCTNMLSTLCSTIFPNMLPTMFPITLASTTFYTAATSYAGPITFSISFA